MLVFPSYVHKIHGAGRQAIAVSDKQVTSFYEYVVQTDAKWSVGFTQETVEKSAKHKQKTNKCG